MKKIIAVLFLFLGLFFSSHAWQELTYKELIQQYQGLAWRPGKECGIRHVLKFTPEQYENKPIALIIVHGTYAADSTEYLDANERFFTSLKKCAEKLAQMQKAPMWLIVYRWSGINSHEARREAGNNLAKILQLFNGFSLFTVGHSQGGNVINIASNQVDAPIELMMHFAVPVMLRGEDYKPNNFMLLCNFYSAHDLLQLIGAHDIATAFKQSFFTRSFGHLSSIRAYGCEHVGKCAGRVVNIGTRFHGAHADHINIKLAITAMPSIINDLSQRYRIHNNFELNLDTRHKDAPFLFIAKPTVTAKVPEDEADYSTQQKNLYKKLYGTDLPDEYKPSYFSIITNTLLLIPGVRSLCQHYNFHSYLPHLSHIAF